MRDTCALFHLQYVNSMITDVDTRHLQVTLREMQALLRDRRFWIGLAALGIVLGLFGPFDTAGLLRTLPRIAYWLPVTLMTFGTGTVLSCLAAASLRDSGCPDMLAMALGGAAAGVPVTAIVVLFNIAALDMPLTHPMNPTILFSTMVISAIVAVTAETVWPSAMPNSANSAAQDPTPDSLSAPRSPAILTRLPVAVRGPLVSLCATDHYTEITTAKGRTLVLIRLADAIAETAPTPGLRIHRSHWVALDQVTAVRRRDARAEVTLTDGRTLPVSRGAMPEIKEAGLLPR